MNEILRNNRLVKGAIALPLGALLLSGCAADGNEAAVRNPSSPAIANGFIDKGVNVRYSAGNTDNEGDGSSNKCGVTDRAIHLDNVRAVTVTGVDGNGTWIGLPVEVLGGMCGDDKDGEVFVSQNVAAVTLQISGDLQASSN